MVLKVNDFKLISHLYHYIYIKYNLVNNYIVYKQQIIVNYQIFLLIDTKFKFIIAGMCYETLITFLYYLSK